jgi:adenosylhomocysteinase
MAQLCPYPSHLIPTERTGLATAEKSYDIADIGLAEEGQRRIEWADRHMPVLGTIRERFEKERPLDGITLGCCLHVTTETANLVRTLIAGGAEVVLCASNPLSTQDDVAAALVDRYGAEVYAINGEDNDTYYRHIHTVVDRGPQITMDDGADVVGVLHGERPEQLPSVLGGTEETTTGVIRLQALERQGKLGYPIIAVNDAKTKHLFDNRYGTGQSTLDGVIRATNVLIAGLRVVVIGYGWCGRGVAMRAKGHGAHVIVCEVDPLRALEALMDGYEVMPGVEAARVGDVFISVTGNRDAIAGEMFEVMKSGAIVCNSGHFDVEVNKEDLDAITVEKFQTRPFVEGHRTKDGREIFLLAEGRLVNLAAAEGHPAAVMDMSFANQALAAEHVVRDHSYLEKRVYPVPEEIDREIARLKLASRGVEIDQLTDAQQKYLASWDQGT